MDDGLAAWSALLRVQAKLVPEFDRRLQEAVDLPLAWYDVLLELYHADDRRLTMGELGRRAVLSRTRISRVVDELVRAGLVARSANPDDGRSAFAVLTEEGRVRFRAAAPVYTGAVAAEFGDRLEPGEAAAIAKALGKLL